MHHWGEKKRRRRSLRYLLERNRRRLYRQTMKRDHSTRCLDIQSAGCNRGWKVLNLHLQEVLQCVCGAGSPFGDLTRNLDDRRKNVPGFVGQQGGSFNVVHLGDLMVELYEVDAGLSPCDGVETVFYEGAGFGLRRVSIGHALSPFPRRERQRQHVPPGH